MNDECERCLRWIKDSIAGELSPGDRSRMEAHLASCPACAHESRLLERVTAHLCDLSEEPVPRHFLVYEDERFRINEMPNWWPRAWLVHHYAVVSDADKLLNIGIS